MHEQLIREGRFHFCRYGHTHYEWGRMLNKRLPDCTVAAAGHMIQLWTANADNLEYTVPDKEIKSTYCKLSGFDPDSTEYSTARGIGPLQVLNYWRTSGIGGHAVHSFAGLRKGNHEDVRRAIYLFGSAYVCLDLPMTAKKPQAVWKVVSPDDLPADDAWKVGPGTWTPHVVSAVAYDEEELTVVSWGFEQRMTWEFYKQYAGPAYGVLSPDWIEQNNDAPNHIDIETLELRLQEVSAEGR